MDDSISRQAALDAMETWDKFGCDPDGKLVRYDDDKHYIPYVHYEDMVHAIKHLPSARPEQRWIPVSERMPEPRIDVWCNSDMGQMVGYYDEYAETWYGRDYLELIVTAWMPLPEPYREEKDD